MLNRKVVFWMNALRYKPKLLNFIEFDDSPESMGQMNFLWEIKTFKFLIENKKVEQSNRIYIGRSIFGWDIKVLVAQDFISK